MIVSAIIRNFKIYKNLNYIPISNGTNFSSFIGENGVGKSSILAAADTFFNKSDLDRLDINNEALEKGWDQREPLLTFILLIEKSKVKKPSHIYRVLELFSDITWQVETGDFNQSQRLIADKFTEHRKIISEFSNAESHFLIPIGVKKENKNITFTTAMSIFESISDYRERFEEELSDLDFSFENAIQKLYSYVRNIYSYIYVPSEIRHEEYSKIESKILQSLLGRSLDSTIKEFVDDSFISGINKDLQEFVDRLAESLKNYKFKKPAKKQSLFNQSHVTSKIIEAFFEDKVLSLVGESELLTPVSHLSSGEKRRALIDVAEAFLKINDSKNNKIFILAVDEPEISLHTGSCFEQFSKLKSISKQDVQTLLTTHWYGFMPVVSFGSAYYISQNPDNDILQLDLRYYREQIKEIKRKTKGMMPDSVEVKGINDLVQSIISSITCNNSMKWIVCEGSSDKIYLDKFFSDKVNVIAVGGSPTVKKIYEYIKLALESDRDDIKGRVLLLLDTDEKGSQYATSFPIEDKVKIVRLINRANKTELIKSSDDLTNPPTEIEDSLNTRVFLKTLMSFKKYNPELLNFLPLADEIVDHSLPSGIGLNLRKSEILQLKEFFSLTGIKNQFALKYIEIDKENDIPNWVVDLKKWLDVE